LVQKGVTATCAEADRNRYGALSGDSNMPDFRLAVGTSSENPFVAAVLRAGGPAYEAALEDQLRRQSWARVLVPAARPLKDVWRPGADLRDPRALPVIIVAGRDEASRAAGVDALAAEVASGRVVVEQSAALVPQPEQVPEWTAALLNRGTPGFAVDCGGALHVSLLRACSGWPSGVWIDPPRRFAPDGSAFELEHWSHAFENALLIGRGDWRQAGCVQEALEYNRPLRLTVTGPHPGTLPTTARLLGLRSLDDDRPGPRGSAVLAALKPAGNALAAGDPPQGAGTAGAGTGEMEVSVRFYEAHGSPVAAQLESRFPIVGAWHANLLEEPGEALALVGTSGDLPGAVTVPVEAGELVTVRLRLATESAPAGASKPAPPPWAEVAQPVFSRYWLHNKGPAPIGNQALAVHVLPTALVLRAGETARLSAQVASGSAHATQSGQLQLVGPEGWHVEPPGRLFSLAAGAFVRLPASVEVPEHCRPGRYFLAVRVAGPAGQAQEDIVTIDVVPALAEGEHAEGRPAWDARALLTKAVPFNHPADQVWAELEAVVESLELQLGPAEAGTIGLLMANCTKGELRGEVQLVSPVETWPYVGPWAQPFRLGPGERGRVAASVHGPGTGWLASWALFKVTYFGRMWYSPSVALRLGAEPAPGRSAAPLRNDRAHAK
jgi:hypothetical protein